MPGWVEDPSLGNIMMDTYNGLQAAPGKALSNIAAADEIKRKRKQDELNMAAVNALDAAVPKASAPPIVRNTPGPWNPDDPNTVMPLGTAMTLPTQRTETPDIEALKAAEAKRAFLVNSGKGGVYKDPTYGPAALGYATVGATGVPTDPNAKSEIQFMTTGKFPTADERAPNPIHNIAIPNPSGGDPLLVATQDGRTVYGTGQRISDLVPPGSAPLATGPAQQTAPNPIENAQVAQNNFNQIAIKALQDEAKGIHMTESQAKAAIMLRDAGWVKEVQKSTDPETGRDTYTPVYKIAPPTGGAAGWLHERLAAYERGDHTRPPAAPAAVDPLAAIGPPTVDETGNPITPRSAPAPAAPTPIVPTGPAPLAGTTQAVGAGNPTPIVNSYKAQPVVNSYENSKSGYSSFISNVPFNNQSSDLAMIVGAAKILDPPSVVREGEVENVRQTGGVMDKFIGMMQGAKGESRLPPEIRMQLWNMVNAKMQQDTKNVQPIYEQHRVRLTDAGLNPDKYIPPLIDLKPVDRSYVSTRSGRGNNAAEEAAAATAPGRRPARQPAGRSVDDIINGR